MNPRELKLGKYLTLDEFCTCTQTYKKYTNQINPYPKNLPEVIPAIEELNKFIIDPIIDFFGIENFHLTYGFCSQDLKKHLEKTDPETGQKNGRIAPNLDQHMAHEVKNNGKYYCERLGASCDFIITNLPSNQLVEWVLQTQLPFDSLYFYGTQRPIHISYGPQHKRDIWTFGSLGQPTKKGIEHWVKLAKQI
ncbi:hypothetical protein NIES4074_13870 [Cylindrospermum sp. NIES-4074]|nr:hypothetical protein NIES4074_13870 [Cylindrospermum sp. NIES-4074]